MLLVVAGRYNFYIVTHYCLSFHKILDLEILDEVVPIHSDEAQDMANELWMIGLPVGVSSGGKWLLRQSKMVYGSCLLYQCYVQ